MITDERLNQIRLTREVVNRAAGRALNDLLDEVERLRLAMRRAIADLREAVPYVEGSGMTPSDVAYFLERALEG